MKQYDSLVNTESWPNKSKLQEVAEEVGKLKTLQRKQRNYNNGQQRQQQQQQ
jgi:hypothetical protein